MNSHINKQKQVEAFWDTRPCDSDKSTERRATREYFLEIEADRYALQSHISEVLGWVQWRRKKVLEIGTGVGTDARRIVQRGGIYTGINVDRGSTELTSKSLSAFNLTGAAYQASATALPFEDRTFDIVYTFGVLHHIPKIESALTEIHRVLNPGGEVLAMVYNRTSINYYLEIMFLRKLFRRALLVPGMVALLEALGLPKGKLCRHRELLRSLGPLSTSEWLSRNTDGPDNPYSRVYGRGEIEALFHRFNIERNEVFFFDHRHWGVIGRGLPPWITHFLGRRWGWHRVVYAQKAIDTSS